MQLTTLAISGYRSLRNLIVPLQRLNVVTGPNGCGKSNLYRALRLLADTAQGRVIQSLAREGGLPSTLWAGPEVISRAMQRGDVRVQGAPRQDRVSLRMGFATDEYGYVIDLGLPEPGRSAFALDPQIKREVLWHGPVRRPSTAIADRRGPLVRLMEGNAVVTSNLATFDSMLTHVSDPRGTPELLYVREALRSWRYYDHFRTDTDAPARLPQVGTHTPVLASDGADLAAAVQTILEIGDAAALRDVVHDAFPGSSVFVESLGGRFQVSMNQPGLLRPLAAAELSDGTLRYLLWIAALLTPRPPSLLVLNEPETSLHPDLLPALGRLIQRAAQHSQILVVSHSATLIDALGADANRIRLSKVLGETTVEGLTLLNTPQWQWPSR